MTTPKARMLTAVAVATNACLGTSKPSIAAERMPPWLPTNPPRSPETAPAIRAIQPPNRSRSARPVRPITPENTSRAPKIAVSRARRRSFRGEAGEVVDAQLLLDGGDLLHGLLESLLPEEAMF